MKLQRERNINREKIRKWEREEEQKNCVHVSESVTGVFDNSENGGSGWNGLSEKTDTEVKTSGNWNNGKSKNLLGPLFTS